MFFFTLNYRMWISVSNLPWINFGMIASELPLLKQNAKTLAWITKRTWPCFNIALRECLQFFIGEWGSVAAKTSDLVCAAEEFQPDDTVNTEASPEESEWNCCISFPDPLMSSHHCLKREGRSLWLLAFISFSHRSATKISGPQLVLFTLELTK